VISGDVKIDLSPLEGLKQTLVSKILRKATSQAAKTVKDAVKGNAQIVKRYGFLSKAIGVKVKVYKDTAVAVVGPRSKWTKTKGVYTRGKKKGEPKVFRPSYYAHLVEKGSKRSKARPFLTPALENTTDTFFSQLAEAIERGISEQLAKSSG
jgi:HK97 gp10 family phage protein